MKEENKNVLLRTEGLEKIFSLKGGAKLHAVDGVDLEIMEGETLGVVGESGCGKSTLGRSILRLIEPTGGKIFFQGNDITKAKGHAMRNLRKNMQIIFQDPYSSIDPRQSVIEAIAEYMFIQKTYRTRKETFNRAAELMDLVGLARRYANSYPHELDGGRRQRIGIARALSLNPKFIVCDEPVSALDVSIQAQILNLLLDLQENSGLSQLMGEFYSSGMEELLVMAESGKYSKSRMVSCIGHLDRTDVVYPLGNTECLCEVKNLTYQKLFQILAQEMNYTTIVLNLGSRFMGFFELLGSCQKIFLMKSRGGLGQWREKEFLTEIQKRGEERLSENLREIQLPSVATPVVSCERLVEQWKWNEFGDSIRRMMPVG